MWVASEPNRGTTFSFSLPVVTNVVAHASNPRLPLLETQHRNGSDGRSVLVAGQDPEAVRIFQRYLDGYQVLTAVAPGEVHTARRRTVVNAVLITDPISEDLRQAIHHHLRGVPTLHCTLHTITRASRQLGVAAFLTKPVTEDQLRQTLRQFKPRPRRAMVVDDDPDMLRLLSRMLRRIVPYCRVWTATSGAAGIALVRNCHPDERPQVVLLDLLMPEMDGHSFIRNWHDDAALRDIPIVVVSAATEEDHDLVIGESVEVRRDGGLRVAELMRIVRGSLDHLLPVTFEAATSGAYASAP
jgi:CheY-like chemotaxis protein